LYRYVAGFEMLAAEWARNGNDILPHETETPPPPTETPPPPPPPGSWAAAAGGKGDSDDDDDAGSAVGDEEREKKKREKEPVGDATWVGLYKFANPVDTHSFKA
jgi:hypothetical protein